MNTKANEGDPKLDKYSKYYQDGNPGAGKANVKPGEGWKRLQLIAQSRVNCEDPDQIKKYPNHKALLSTVASH